MPGQGRLGDKANIPADAHGCPACPHPGTGPAIMGSPTVMVNGRPALRLNDTGMHAACCGPNTWQAAQGSSTVFINARPAHRMTDATKHCGGYGQLIEGSADVIVGGSPTSGGSGGGGGAGADDAGEQGPADASGSGAEPGEAGADGSGTAESADGTAASSADPAGDGITADPSGGDAGASDPAGAPDGAASQDGSDTNQDNSDATPDATGDTTNDAGSPDAGSDPPAAATDCLCAAGASDRDCIIAVIDKWLGPVGQDSSVTKLGLQSNYTSTGGTSCGDVLHALIQKWGSDDRNCFFMVNETDQYDGTNTPQRGDIFILCKKGDPSTRQHVGLVYETSGSAPDFQWRSAEGGQGLQSAQTMHINANLRGPNDGAKVLHGWRNLDSFTRDRAKCKKNNKP